MTGNEYLKLKREEKKLTVRGYAMKCGITPRMVSYYETGGKQIGSIPVIKILRMFSIFDTDVDGFFDLFYPYKTGIDEAVAEWEKNHPRCYKASLLKKKYYQRLAKIKERKNVDPVTYDILISLYEKIFESDLSDVDELSRKQYDAYILTLNYKIRSALAPLPENDISKKIVTGMYHTEYNYSDIGQICGVTRQHLSGCIDGTYDIETIHTSLALKLCYLLKLDFKKVFAENVNF